MAKLNLNEFSDSEKTIEKLIVFMAKRRNLFSFNKEGIEEAIMLSVNKLTGNLAKKYFPEIYREDEDLISPIHIIPLFKKIITNHILKGSMYVGTISVNGSEVEKVIKLSYGLQCCGGLETEEINELSDLETKLYYMLTGRKKLYSQLIGKDL